MNIKEFREKYPQYDKMPDQVLAQRLHRIHYANKMSYDEFAKKFGVPPLPTVAKGIKTAEGVISQTKEQFKKEQADATKLKRLFTFAGKSEKEAERLANSLASNKFAEQVEQIKKPKGTPSLAYDYVQDMREIRNRATPEESKAAMDLVRQTNLNLRTVADPDAPPELKKEVSPIKEPLNPDEKREAMKERGKLFIEDAAKAYQEMLQAPQTRYEMTKRLEEYEGKFLKKTYLRWERGAVMVGGGAMHFMDEITKLATAGEYGDTFADQADLYHKALSSPQMQPVIEHWGDRYFGAAIESAPFTLAAMPAAIATGGAVIPSGINAFLTSYAIEGNMAYQAAKDRGLTEREARARGIATGIVNGAFEVAGGGAGKYVRMNAIKNITGRLAKHRFLTKQLLTNAVKEGLAEEVPQELGHMFVGGDISRMKDGSINWHKASQRVVDTAIAGTIIGSIYGGGAALRNHAAVEYNDWVTRTAPQRLETGAPAAANITNKVEFEDSQMYELDTTKQAQNLASQMGDKAELLGVDIEINQTGQYVDVKRVNKEAQEHQQRPVQKSEPTPAPAEAIEPREMARKDAINTIKKNVPSNILDGWFRKGDKSYKDRLVEAIIQNEETKNAALNLLHQEYQRSTGKTIPFEKFMNTPLTLYRAGEAKKGEAFTSYTYDKKEAQKHAERTNTTISEIKIKPKATYGSLQTTAEGEVLVPAPAETAEEKKPWEMTRGEFETSQREKRQALIKRWNKTRKGLGPPSAKLSISERTALAERAGFIPKTKEFIQAAEGDAHKLQVQVAVVEGKPVSRKVLEEYKGEEWADEALARPAPAETAEIHAEVTAEPTTADEAIGLEYGLNPEETRATLNEAENRYRTLKNKDERTKAEQQELKFLKKKKNRKSIEALLNRATDPEGKPINKVGSKTVKLLKDGHDIPAEFDWTEKERRDFNELHTGKRSMSNMTSAEREYLVKLLKTKKASKRRKFSPASVLKYVQPQWRTAIKLGIDFITNPLEAAKMVMNMEEQSLLNEIDKIGKVINKLGGETMGTKLKSKIINEPTSARERYARLLDSYEAAPDFLNDEEKVVFEFLRNLGDTMWMQTNEAREATGRKLIPYRKAYIPHMASVLASDSLHDIQLWPKELSALAKKHATRKIYNPMEFKRQIERELNSALERDVIKLMKAMVHISMREIHLSKPLQDAKKKIGMHKVDMPESTFKELEQYISANIRGEQTRFDKLMNNLLTNEGSEWALNKVLKPFGRTISSRPITSALMTGGRLQIYGVLGWRPKQWLRNKFQVIQCMALHGVTPTLKGYFQPNKELKKLMTDDLFLQTYSGMEEMPATGMGKAKRIFMGPFQWTAVTNARHAFKTAYHDYIQLIRDPKYKKFGWADPQRDYTEADDFLYMSERDRLKREMVLSAKATQYHYLASGMPGVFRTKALTPLTRLQSWWLNHIFSFQASTWRRAVKGETAYGEKLPYSRRVNALKYLTLGGTLLNTLGYGSSFAAGTVPGGLPPYAGALYHAFMWLKGLLMGNDRIRKAESRKFWNNAKTLVPGYFTAKDIKGLLTGKTRFQEWLFYAGGIFDKEEKDSTFNDFKGL